MKHGDAPGKTDGAAHAAAALHAARGVLAACAALLLAGCGVIDLSPFSVSTYPAEPETIIEELPAVWALFSEPVDHDDAESILSVSADGEPVYGDFTWEGECLTFTPLKAFCPGKRHELRLEGTVRTSAGRSFSELTVVTFYVGTDASPATITEVSPEEGGVCAAASPLLLTFSRPMDTDTFSDAFSLSPAVAHALAWSQDLTQVTVTPVERWDHAGLATWTVTTACASADGVALGRPWTGTFLAQEDAESPWVVQTGPAAVEGADVLPLPGGLSDMLYGDSLRIVFSEDVDAESLDEAFSLSPSLAGTLRRISAGVFVLVPAEGWDMGQEYVLTVSTDLKDASGNPLRSAHRELFTPAIPVQAVTAVSLGGDLDAAASYGGSALNNRTPVVIDWLPSSTVGMGDLDLILTIRFAQGYDPEPRPIVAEAVELAGYYPEVTSPRITQVDWLDSRTLVISYTGFSYSAASPSLERLFYMLTISRGASQTMNQEGSYLKEEVTLLLESGTDS